MYDSKENLSEGVKVHTLIVSVFFKNRTVPPEVLGCLTRVWEVWRNPYFILDSTNFQSQVSLIRDEYGRQTVGLG